MDNHLGRNLRMKSNRIMQDNKVRQGHTSKRTLIMTQHLVCLLCNFIDDKSKLRMRRILFETLGRTKPGPDPNHASTRRRGKRRKEMHAYLYHIRCYSCTLSNGCVVMNFLTLQSGGAGQYGERQCGSRQWQCELCLHVTETTVHFFLNHHHHPTILQSCN